MRRVDYQFSTAEAAWLTLTHNTRRVRLLSPDGAAEQVIKFDGALPDGSDDPAGRLVTEWINAAAVTSRSGGVWGTIPSPRAYLDDGRVALAWVWDPADLTVPADSISTGDYLILENRDGVEWDANAPALVRVQWGRFSVREGVAYESNEEWLERQIARLRDIIAAKDGAGPNNSLVSVTAPDGREEKYTSLSMLIKQMHILEARLSFLRATDGGKFPFAAFRIVAY